MVKKKILIIDDEESFTRVVKLNLEAIGRYEVRIENKGSLGLKAAKEFKPDLILLDIFMPDEEGSEVALQLKEDYAVKKIPVVFLTAAVRKEEAKASFGVIGGHPFLAKPVTVQELVSYIEENIDKPS